MQFEFANICGKHMVLPFIVAEDYFRDHEKPVYTATPEQIETYITRRVYISDPTHCPVWVRQPEPEAGDGPPVLQHLGRPLHPGLLHQLRRLRPLDRGDGHQL